MANIKNFKNHDGATFNDNSITINATQNSNNVEVLPQVNITADVTASAEQHTPKYPADFPNIVFDGNKTDFARVINAFVLKRCFKRPDGTLATQEEVFTLFDKVFRAGLKDYEQLLYQTKDASVNANSKVFDTLKDLCLKYAKGEISNN